MRYAHIIGWGKFAPEKVMTNDDLSKYVNTSDTWIRERTGIRQRHIAGPRDSAATMAVAAALEALDVANISAAQIGLIIVATSTPDYTFPATACMVQDALGADNAGAFDLSAACSGFVYGLSLAADAIKAHSIEYALIIGSETMTRIVDWSDRNTCVLFGDGAGAIVLQGSEQPGGILATALHSDGSGGETLSLRHNYREQPFPMSAHDGAAAAAAGAPGATAAVPSSTLDDRAAAASAASVYTGNIYMNGREVFRFGTRILAGATREVLNKAGWEVGDIDILIPHQANIRIIEAASKSLAMPLDKFYCNIDRYGNTSAASIPLAICEAASEGRLRPNDKVVMVGFGAGLTWASAALQWGTPRVLNRTNRTLNRVRTSIANIRSRARRELRHIEDRLFGTIDPSATSTTISAPPPANPPGRNGTSAGVDHARTATRETEPADKSTN